MGALVGCCIGCGQNHPSDAVAPTAPVTSGNVPAPEAVATDNSVRGHAAADDGRLSPTASGTTQQPAVSPSRQGSGIAGGRLPDDRPPFSETDLRAAGLRVVRSRRLVLVSDLPLQQIEGLPQLADQLFDVLEARLGKLPPAPDNSEFQVTGCLMDARERFQAAGLLPELELVIRHGRHLNYRFWMFNPPSDYYRRHLLLHEFTHCFMTCQHGMRRIPPLWYTEGIAEYFATHQIAEQNNALPRFGVLPESVERFPGWGRISEVRRSFSLEPSVEPQDAGLRNLETVLHPDTPLFQDDLQYALAWALYWMLADHPEYQRVFAGFRPVRSDTEFAAAMQAVPETVWRTLAVDWLLTQESLTEGFDTQRAFPSRRTADGSAAGSLPAAVLLPGVRTSLSIVADRGWQSAGVTLRQGQVLRLTSTGRFAVAHDPKPWFSEPQGITIEYHRGLPLGMLVAILAASDGSRATCRIPIGTDTVIEVPWDAELWLQINDSAASRRDNSGQAEVTVDPGG